MSGRRVDESQDLREDGEGYRRLYHQTPVMLQSIDSEGRIIRVSDYWLEVMGYSGTKSWDSRWRISSPTSPERLSLKRRYHSWRSKVAAEISSVASVPKRAENSMRRSLRLPR